jgi:2-methylcitrate dehydratase PrpD
VTIAVTEIISTWASKLRFEDIPPRTIACAKEQVIGIVAAILAGSRTEECGPLYKALRDWGDREESTVIGANMKTSMRNAGMVNSIVAQTLEWEDYLRSQHTGASTVPNALAVGEAVNASGKQFLTALVAGNEICGRTGHAYIKSHLFTNSCPNHQIDAAIVAGKLLGLNSEQMMDALGISCFPPMTQCFAGWFSPTKGLITGAPVHAGITGACLAKAGFKGFRKIIEHPDGFSSAIFERYDLEEMVRDLGSDWRTDTHSPKLYPCCGWLDALIDSALDIMQEHSVDWRDISGIDVQSPTVTLLLNKPKDELIELIDRIATTDYLTCVPLYFNSIYPLAVAIMDGELTPAQFSKERITDKKLHDFFDRIHFTVDPSLDVKEMQEGINSGGVKIRLKNGTEYSKFTDAMKGSYKNPIDIREKLEICTRHIMDNGQRDEIYDAAGRIDKMDSIRDFTGLLL